MKKFSEYINESDNIRGIKSLGGDGGSQNQYGRWGQEPVHMGVHRIEDPNVLQRLNAHIGIINTREYIDPVAALEHLQNALMRLGYLFEFDRNSVPQGQQLYELSRFGGRQGFIDMDAVYKRDDFIEPQMGEEMVLSVEFVEDPGTARYQVFAQIVPESLFDEEEAEELEVEVPPNRASIPSTTGDRDGINVGEGVEPLEEAEALSRTFLFKTPDARDRIAKLLDMQGAGAVSTSDKAKGALKYSVSGQIKRAQLDTVMKFVKQLKGKLGEETWPESEAIAEEVVQQLLRERDVERSWGFPTVAKAERFMKQIGGMAHNVYGMRQSVIGGGAYVRATFDNSMSLSDAREIAKKLGGKVLREARDVPTKHQLKIARDTVKMNPSMRGVMGGMSYDKAMQVLAKHGTPAEKRKAEKHIGKWMGDMGEVKDENCKEIERTKRDEKAAAAFREQLSKRKK